MIFGQEFGPIGNRFIECPGCRRGARSDLTLGDLVELGGRDAGPDRRLKDPKRLTDHAARAAHLLELFRSLAQDHLAAASRALAIRSSTSSSVPTPST